MLVLFLADDKKRQSLPDMPKSQREVVHKLASLFGITTQSYGQEPKRHVELFKVCNSLLNHLGEMMSRRPEILICNWILIESSIYMLGSKI